jgi:mannose-6-phosphate isomerase-like protein (cupin superfamily)
MTATVVPIIREADQGEMTYLSETWYQVWKAKGETTNGIVDTWFEVVPPQIGPPEHRHAQYDEGFWVVKGTFLIKVAERTVKASEGAWIFVPAGMAHTFRNIGTENGHLLIQAFPGGGMSKYFEEVSAIMASGPADQQALQRVNEQYGIVMVGPPLEGEAQQRISQDTIADKKGR